jgi:hypothetical protein
VRFNLYRDAFRYNQPVIALRVLLLAGSLLTGAGCSGLGTLLSPSVSREASEVASAVPEWRAGDRWVYGWTSGKESGTRTIEVRELANVNGVEYYILDVGGGIRHYYTKELHFAAAVHDAKVIARMVPPAPWFTWPLATAAQWSHRGSYEEQQAAHPQDDTFRVLGASHVTVPAGTYRTFEVQRQSRRGDTDQYWYAPEIRWYVRWLGKRGDVTFEERLSSYRAAPRT